MSQMIFQQNEIAYLKFIEEFDQTYKQYAITQAKASSLEKMKIKLSQAEEKLKFMQVEAQDCQPQLKSEFTPKLKQHKMSYADRKQKLKSIDLYKQETPQPSRLANTNKLEDQANTLQHLNQKLEGTAETSENILVDIKGQKEKLLQATEDVNILYIKTNIIRSDVQQTGRYIKMIQNRELFGKLVKIGLIIVLTVGNILVIYYKF